MKTYWWALLAYERYKGGDESQSRGFMMLDQVQIEVEGLTEKEALNKAKKIIRLLIE